MGRGFGVSAAVDHAVVTELAREAEQLGYTSFWVNDIPNFDGLASLAAASAGTTEIMLGVGVIPLDQRTPSVIDRGVESFELPLGRLLLGVGSGGGRDALARVRAGVIEAKRETRAPIVVGALGPKMAQLAGEVADGVLLNWMTADYLAHSGDLVQEAATRRRPSGPDADGLRPLRSRAGSRVSPRPGPRGLRRRLTLPAARRTDGRNRPRHVRDGCRRRRTTSRDRTIRGGARRDDRSGHHTDGRPRRRVAATACMRARRKPERLPSCDSTSPPTRCSPRRVRSASDSTSIAPSSARS